MDRNVILAVVLSMGVLLIWDILVVNPQREALEAQRRVAAQQATSAPGASPLAPKVEEQALTVEEALAAAPRRIVIDTPSVDGSINLVGGRIDDLSLKNYREERDPQSPEIRLLTPREAVRGHYLQQGWASAADAGEDALWSAPPGARLTVETPVILTREADGLIFEKRVAIDKDFVFTVTETVKNTTSGAVALTPYALVIQRGFDPDVNKYMILHEGPIAVIGRSLFQKQFKNKEFLGGAGVEEAGTGGWVGITNKYWLAAAMPPQGEEMSATLANIGTRAAPIYRASYTLAPRTIAPGETAALTSHFFGGAKDVDILRSYQKATDKGGLGIARFDEAVDWGNFWLLTRPIFATLDFLGDHVGNWGIAILLLTIIVRALVFPLANRAYAMTSKMKKIQPQMEELKARFKDDAPKLQQGMMELYKKEKLNPVAGCLPILIQMPIFYALYKTLFVTIELRHQPFFLWIQDLSAPDPTNIFNLFGLLPFDPSLVPFFGAFLQIGVLPLLMGVAMWFQLKLNPPPADPVQAQVFAIMPWLFVFMFAPFSAGLVLYWVWSTVLSIVQQVVIMKRYGVEVDWKENFRPPWTKKKKAAVAAAGE